MSVVLMSCLPLPSTLFLSLSPVLVVSCRPLPPPLPADRLLPVLLLFTSASAARTHLFAHHLVNQCVFSFCLEVVLNIQCGGR